MDIDIPDVDVDNEYDYLPELEVVPAPAFSDPERFVESLSVTSTGVRKRIRRTSDAAVPNARRRHSRPTLSLPSDSAASGRATLHRAPVTSEEEDSQNDDDEEEGEEWDADDAVHWYASFDGVELCETEGCGADRHDGDEEREGSCVPPPLSEVELLEHFPHWSQMIPMESDAAPSWMRPRVISVIAHGKFSIPNAPPNTQFDLHALSCVLRTSKYTIKKSAAARVLLIDAVPLPSMVSGYTRVLQLFPSGAYSVWGTRSAEEANAVARLVLRMLRLSPPSCITVPATSWQPSSSAIELDERMTTVLRAEWDIKCPVRIDALARSPPISASRIAGLRWCVKEHSPMRQCCHVWMIGYGRMREGGRECKADDTEGNYEWRVHCEVHVTGRIRFHGARNECELQHAFHALVPLVSPFIACKRLE